MNGQVNLTLEQPWMNVLVAVLMVIGAAGLAGGVKNVLEATLGTLSYRRIPANIAAGGVLVVGMFAALSQVNVAPAIVNDLCYAALAVISGAAIVTLDLSRLRRKQR